jgi:hypothetical protein
MRPNKKQILILIVLSTILVLSACGKSAGETPVASEESYPAPLTAENPVSDVPAVADLPDYLAPAEMLPLTAPTDADIPKPSAGLASVGGIPVYTDVMRTLYPSMSAYLTPAVGQGNDVMYPVQSGPTANDFATLTDEHGWVLFKDVPPGNYFLVVIRPPGWTVAAQSQEKLGVNLLITLAADEVKNLGIIYLP